jgi:hypothetical protein
MNREQLCHVVRAAADIAGVDDVLVLGSQAVLGTHEDWVLPAEATRSIEADLAVDLALARADEGADESELADRIDGALGEGSQFHAANGYYAQGVERITATLTSGWRDRLVALVCERASQHPVVGWCLDINDLWLSKAVVGRDKDWEFCLALAVGDLVDLDEVERRSDELTADARRNARAVIERARSAT